MRLGTSKASLERVAYVNTRNGDAEEQRDGPGRRFVLRRPTLACYCAHVNLLLLLLLLLTPSLAEAAPLHYASELLLLLTIWLAGLKERRK